MSKHDEYLGTYGNAEWILTDPNDAIEYGDAILLDDRGTTRKVFLMEGVVYKVPRYDSEDCSFIEFERLSMWKDTCSCATVPRFNMFTISGTPVISMEYINFIAHTPFVEPAPVPAHVIEQFERFTYDLQPITNNLVRSLTDDRYYCLDMG